VLDRQRFEAHAQTFKDLVGRRSRIELAWPGRPMHRRRESAGRSRWRLPPNRALEFRNRAQVVESAPKPIATAWVCDKFGGRQSIVEARDHGTAARKVCSQGVGWPR
jgi:hypothetical protein